jgi:mono/diheme cytochrome c family protein
LIHLKGEFLNMIGKTGEVLLVAAAMVGAALVTPSAWAADAAAGKAVFDKKCRVCHGAEGQGNPGMAKALKVEFKALGSADVQKMSDAELKKVITSGMGKMKPVSGLSDADADNVVAHVRTLKK